MGSDMGTTYGANMFSLMYAMQRVRVHGIVTGRESERAQFAVVVRLQQGGRGLILVLWPVVNRGAEVKSTASRVFCFVDHREP
jgi:hypothetical protein